ncbi:MFS transporter [Solirubrobacter ginsenosidimutans]|uniref:MFS transporter n=1 Tax=Solirubrobacter ginsenosidimutans TaxID=490573 RepID=A0A9X3RZR0_9ACTN|nr:MFS transporter [Solirubrobacter ginsenosidimutans]MDA0160514.1 MFS transporter [Solirubrobacter ginsenosidimutans]
MTVASGRLRAGAFGVVAASWFAMMAASNVATPLYAIYEREFGFSKAVLTLVFATYALVLAPSLLVFGQLSDRLGRRRVMATGFATATVGLVLFAGASSLVWLFAARAVQGLAIGMISGAAAAALFELDPAPQEDRAALFSALAQAGGSASGPLIAGMLAEWAPARLVLPFVVFIGLGVAATVAALAIPEPGRVRGGRLTIVRPSVPAEIRVLFARVSLTGALVWAVAAFFLSVVPSYAAELLDTSNLALLGAISAVMLAASCVAQIAARGGSSYARMQAGGLVLLALGLLALALAFPTRSLLVLLFAGLLCGAGHGLGFLGGQAQLSLAAPPDERGAVNAAFYTLIYLGVATAVVSTGLLTLHFALSTAVTAFTIVVGTFATVTAVWHMRSTAR